MNTEETIRTTREASRAVPCPDCGAAPGQPCIRDTDTPSHSARHELAVAQGAERVRSTPRRTPRADDRARAAR